MLYPTVYSVLVRWGPEWDGQSVFYTESLALFEILRDNCGNNKYFDDFSDKLKAEIKTKYDAFDWAVDYAPDPLEDIDILQAMEWLEHYPMSYPLMVVDHTEFTPSWNW